MTDMQRRRIPVFAWYYKGEVVAPPDAEVVVVLASDAEAAIAAARRDALSARIREVKPYADGWVEGQRDMLAKCIKAVEAFGVLCVWESWIATDGRRSGGHTGVDVVAALRALDVTQ